eukprot:1157312-Pelagomonas_calceolata.AAC.14
MLPRKVFRDEIEDSVNLLQYDLRGQGEALEGGTSINQWISQVQSGGFERGQDVEGTTTQSELRGGWVIRSVHQCGPLSLIDVGSHGNRFQRRQNKGRKEENARITSLTPTSYEKGEKGGRFASS